MFSNATTKLNATLSKLVESQNSNSKRDNSNEQANQSMLGSSLSSINKNSEYGHLYHFKSKTSILSGLASKPLQSNQIFAQSSNNNNRTISVESQREEKSTKDDPKRQIHVIHEKKKRLKSLPQAKQRVTGTNQTTINANNLIININ